MQNEYRVHTTFRKFMLHNCLFMSSGSFLGHSETGDKFIWIMCKFCGQDMADHMVLHPCCAQ